MTDPGKPSPRGASPRWVERIEQHTGRVCLAAVPVRDREWSVRRRGSFVSHGVVFALGLLLMQTLGLGWVLVPLAVVIHHLAFGPKRLLIAMAAGLEVVEMRARSVVTVAQIPVGSSATVTLRSDQPQVQLAITGQPAPEAADGTETADSAETADSTETAETTDSTPGLEKAPAAQTLLWEGTVSGNDLKAAEEIIRSGGGEPVRVKH